jgi:hypothetical protein
LLHRVQKVIRDKENSLDKEFPTDGSDQERQERLVADYIMRMTKKFHSDSQHWLKPYQIKMLAEDTFDSELRCLALRSTNLIPY